MDKTYIRVGGKWCYLYRAITTGGQTLDFYLSPKRNIATAKRLLAKAISELKEENICPPTVEHRQTKYLNNVIDGDHGRLKPILGPKGVFKNLTFSYRTLKGIEAMHRLRKSQGTMFDLTGNQTRTR